MWKIKRMMVWLGRIHRCRGFGVQSPWAYRLVRNVINERYPYYAYAPLAVAHPHADAVTRKLCELCLPYVKVGGQFLAMKTTESASEVEEAAHCIKLLGGRAEEPVDYAIPGTQVTHRVLPIRKLAPTLKGYPRRWARIQKQPL